MEERLFIFTALKGCRRISKGITRAGCLRRGYNRGTPGRCMMQLMERLSSGGEFPREIGLFLGYPPEDVEGFIRNKAECSKCCGHWKVYGDEHRARDLFNRYNQCTQAYCAQWMAGKSLEDLTVQIGQTDKMRRTIA